MPRIARNFSSSGYVHLISRGIGRQILFEEDADYQFYLDQLKRISKEEKVTVLAYCLMDNHIHLLVSDCNGNISSMMNRLGTTYALYYNKKYDRTGHVFQNRYKNQNIETETVLLAVFRYILNNPAKAGICQASDYKWSSYRFYEDPSSFVDTSRLSELIGGKQEFYDFMNVQANDVCFDSTHHHTNDAGAQKKLTELLSGQHGIDLQRMDKDTRNRTLHMLKENGLSVRQISRLTGIGRSIVQRA